MAHRRGPRFGANVLHCDARWPNGSFSSEGAASWASDACVAEVTQSSCFYLGSNHKAAELARRRYSPHACDLPPIEPLALGTRHTNTTFLFWGDSVARQAFIAFACALREIVPAGAELSGWRPKPQEPEKCCPFPHGVHCTFGSHRHASLVLHEGISLEYHGDNSPTAHVHKDVGRQLLETAARATLRGRATVLIAQFGHHLLKHSEFTGVVSSALASWDAAMGAAATHAASSPAGSLAAARASRFFWLETTPVHFATPTQASSTPRAGGTATAAAACRMHLGRRMPTRPPLPTGGTP